MKFKCNVSANIYFLKPHVTGVNENLLAHFPILNGFLISVTGTEMLLEKLVALTGHTRSRRMFVWNFSHLGTS